jgi:uncharacterized repeat protein (TIGR03847 family)
VSQSFDFEQPDFFTTGAIGKPGERVFYLQAREKGVLITLKCEKGQVKSLGDYLAGLITKLGAPKGTVPTDMDLLEFAEPAWIVSTLGVGYDDDHDRIIVEAHELFEEEEEGQRAGEEPASARVRITREQAQAFVTRVTELMKAGRPNCPVCSEPMDAGGHVCRRSNGHIAH